MKPISKLTFANLTDFRPRVGIVLIDPYFRSQGKENPYSWGHLARTYVQRLNAIKV